MADNAESVVQKTVDDFLADIVVVEQGNYDQLHLAATKFIKTVQDYYELSLHYQTIVRTKTLKNGLQNFYQYMRENTNFTKNIVQIQNVFQTQFNQFLGRKVDLAWVSSDGKIIFRDEANLGNIYKSAFGQYGRGGISASTIAGYSSDIEEELRKRFEESQRERVDVYLEIVSRWKDSEKEKKIYYHKENLQRKYFEQRYQNRGPIAEGYVDAVINEVENIRWTGIVGQHGVYDEQKQTSIFNLVDKHININSTAALIKGDVVLDTDQETGKIHFAVKTNQFSSASFGQYYALATNIKKHPEGIKDLEGNIKQYIKNTSIIKNTLNEIQKKVKEVTSVDNLTK